MHLSIFYFVPRGGHHGWWMMSTRGVQSDGEGGGRRKLSVPPSHHVSIPGSIVTRPSCVARYPFHQYAVISRSQPWPRDPSPRLPPRDKAHPSRHSRHYTHLVCSDVIWREMSKAFGFVDSSSPEASFHVRINHARTIISRGFRLNRL